jgi:DNA-binding transcriptional LysR family regulator
VTNEIHDIVASGYDAGIHLGEVIDRDMIAVPVSGDLRLVVVSAPSYFAQHRKPKHPRDLVEHDCLNWHATPDAPPYRGAGLPLTITQRHTLLGATLGCCCRAKSDDDSRRAERAHVDKEEPMTNVPIANTRETGV